MDERLQGGHRGLGFPQVETQARPVLDGDQPQLVQPDGLGAGEVPVDELSYVEYDPAKR